MLPKNFLEISHVFENFRQNFLSMTRNRQSRKFFEIFSTLSTETAYTSEKSILYARNWKIPSNFGNIYLSKVSCCKDVKSQAIYSKALSVIRGHHDKSSDLNFRKFSEINSMPSSVIFVHPERLSIVRLGSE